MTTNLQETSGNMPVDLNLINLLGTKQGTWTAKGLGIKLEEDTTFTKESFEKSLKKVSQRKPAQERS